MKKIFLISFLMISFSFSQVYYNFQKEKPLNYDFQIKGNVSFDYSGAGEEKFDVSLKGKIKIETFDQENEIYILKITPYKTLIKLGSQTLEDITSSETMVSSLITTSYIKMKKTGQIIESKELTKGIIEIPEILKILPVFPEKIVSGKRWIQQIPSFELPGIPICPLKFNYIYKKDREISSIILSSNQKIDEIKKEKDIKVIFKGINNSNGTFYFNEKNGEIEKFDGKFLVTLNIKFEVPSVPEKKKTQSVPLKISLNLDISLKRE